MNERTNVEARMNGTTTHKFRKNREQMSTYYNNACVCAYVKSQTQSIGVKRARAFDSTIACYATHLIEFESIAHIPHVYVWDVECRWTKAYMRRCIHPTRKKTRTKKERETETPKRTIKYFTKHAVHVIKRILETILVLRALRFHFDHWRTLNSHYFHLSLLYTYNNNPNELWKVWSKRNRHCERLEYIFAHQKHSSLIKSGFVYTYIEKWAQFYGSNLSVCCIRPHTLTPKCPINN